MWDLEYGLEFIRDLEARLAPHGWHCSLGGGVLRNGSSSHDIDVICYPHSTAAYDLSRLYEGLEECGLERFRTKEQMHESWRTNRKSDDQKHVEVWFKNARRVDVIIWPPQAD